MIAVAPSKMATNSETPVSPCTTPDPGHAAREMAVLVTFNADYRNMLRTHCDGDLGEYIRNGGTIETLRERMAATVCNTCGLSPEDLQGRKGCSDC